MALKLHAISLPFRKGHPCENANSQILFWLIQKAS
jgi:hypothetical protein